MCWWVKNKCGNHIPTWNKYLNNIGELWNLYWKITWEKLTYLGASLFLAQPASERGSEGLLLALVRGATVPVASTIFVIFLWSFINKLWATSLWVVLLDFQSIFDWSRGSTVLQVSPLVALGGTQNWSLLGCLCFTVSSPLEAGFYRRIFVHYAVSTSQPNTTSATITRLSMVINGLIASTAPL